MLFYPFLCNLRFFCLLSISFSLFFVLSSFPGFAAENGPRVHDNKLYKLSITLEAPDGQPWATDPRQQAILEAHREAFQCMSVYLTKEKASKLPPDNMLFDMVDSFSVEQEKVNVRSYRGEFSFVFKPEALGRAFAVSPEKFRGKGQEQRVSKDAFDPTSQALPLILSVHLKRFSDWIELQNTLDKCGPSLVRSKKILSLSQDHGVVELALEGELTTLQGRLALCGFSVVQQPGKWEIEKTSDPYEQPSSRSGLPEESVS